MTDGIYCHVTHCGARGHYLGDFQAPFCQKHMRALTPLKQALVESIRSFSVLDPGARLRAIGIVKQCRLYLAEKEMRAQSGVVK